MGSSGPRRYTRGTATHGRRPSRPRRLPLESQVLPERHRHAVPRRGYRGAAVHLDQHDHRGQAGRVLGSSSTTWRGPGRRGDPAPATVSTVKSNADPKTYAVVVPERPDPGLQRHGRPRPPRAGRTLDPNIYKAEAVPDTSWLEPDRDRRPAAADHRRVHLLHDAPGPGHEQPGHVASARAAPACSSATRRS